MCSHCSSTNKRGWGPSHFVPLLPFGTDALQEAEWVTVIGKRKREKRKAETQKVASSPSKRKTSNFHFPMNQPTSDFTQPSVQQGSAAEAKPKGAVLHREVTQEATSAVSPAKKNTSEEKKSASVPKSSQAYPEGEVPQCQDKQEPNTGKKRQGAAYYGSSFKKSGQNNGTSSEQPTIRIASIV